MEDLREVVDDLRADMAQHERRTGEPHDARNHSLAVDAVTRMERERADAKPVAPVEPPPLPEIPTGKREINGNTYRVEKLSTPLPIRSASEFESQVLAHAMPRIELLMSKVETGILGTPSWRDRTSAAMYFKVKALEARAVGQIDLETFYERAYQLDLYELLEESNKAFGDWRKSPEQKLVVSVSG